MNEPISPLKIWILATRPKTLWAGFSPVLIGTAIAYEDGMFHGPSALVALLGALLIQIGANFFNDYSDFKKGADTGERKGPLRVTQAGLVKPKTMLMATLLVFALFAVCCAYLVTRGGLPVLIIGAAAIVAGFAYTAGPFPLAYVGLGDVFAFVFFGPVAVAGTFYVQAEYWSIPSVIAGFAPGFFSVAILTVNNLRDIDTDRKAGKKTLAVRFGKGFARFEYVTCLVGALAVPVFLYTMIYRHAWAMIVLLMLPLTYQAVMRVMTSTRGAILNPVLAYTSKLLLVYSVLFSIGWNL